jgi:hypothetical protein
MAGQLWQRLEQHSFLYQKFSQKKKGKEVPKAGNLAVPHLPSHAQSCMAAEATTIFLNFLRLSP